MAKAKQQLTPQEEVNRREQLDPYTRFLYVPRTVSALLAGMAALVWYSGALDSVPPNQPDFRAGLVACCCVYLGYSTLQGPSSVMIRPHPAVWKFVHGCCMLYLLFLVFILSQGKDEARRIMKYLDPTLGVPLKEREYGGDCRLYIPNEGWNLTTLRETLFDEFVIAHTLGWFVKAAIMRNYWMLWTCSIGFELMEITFQHWLLNFNECWWDSWLLDVLGCNLVGLLAGMACVKYFGSKKYDWQGLSQQKGVIQKAKRGLAQFLPHSVEIWNWATFSSPLRFVQAFFLVIVIMAFELNAFFLKTLLWVPPSCYLNVVRLCLMGVLALPGVKEYHAWLDNDDRNVFVKLGAYAWLAAAILFTEILTIIKFGHGEFTAPFPEHIKVFWGGFFALLAGVLSVWQVSLWVGAYRRQPKKLEARKRQ